MKQVIDEISQKNKLIEKKLKVFGLDSIKVDGNFCGESSECRKFQQEIEYSDIRNNVSCMDKNIKKLSKEIEQYKNSIASLNQCLGGRVNVSEMKQAAIKRQMSLQELKNKQIVNDSTILNIIQRLKDLE
ncbi:hypothetical protein ACKWTF_002934 [Chironomus riparius]